MSILLNDLRQRVAVQRPILIEDGQGGFLERWENLYRIWVKITPVLSYSLYNRGQRLGTLQEESRLYKGVARLYPTLQKRMQLHWKSLFLIIIDDPIQEEGYQFFTLSKIIKSDGVFYE
jgi:hypothetical protein